MTGLEHHELLGGKQAQEETARNMNLRPYQADLFNAMRHSLATGHRRIMCVAPCGTIDIDIMI